MKGQFNHPKDDEAFDQDDEMRWDEINEAISNQVLVDRSEC